jgi:Cu-processing system permease protein
MRPTVKILRYELRNVLRSRAIAVYALFFLAMTELLFRFSDGPRALLSLATVTLIVVPLVSLVLGMMFVYSAREFNELLLSQPVDRHQLFAGLYLGFVTPLMAAYVTGVGVPALIHGTAVSDPGTLALLLFAGAFLTAIFSALAFVVAIRIEDQVRGIGAGLLAWLLLAVVYDGLVMAMTRIFWAYPLETPLIALMILNPIDLARLVVLMRFDAAAMLGYTGAAFRDFFEGSLGVAIALSALGAWLAVPIAVGLRAFSRKDF